MKQIFYDVIEYNWVKDLMIDCKNLDQQKKNWNLLPDYIKTPSVIFWPAKLFITIKYEILQLLI